MDKPRLDESTVVEIATQFIQSQMRHLDVQFSSATYFTTNHHYAPLHHQWLAYFNLVEPGVLASSSGVTIRVDDQTGIARNTHAQDAP